MSKEAQEKLIEVLRLLAREARFPPEQMDDAITDLRNQFIRDDT